MTVVRKPGLSLRSFLIISSVMLNLFFVSFLGVRLVQNRSPICIDRRITLAGLVAALPRADREKFATALKQDVPHYIDQLKMIGNRRDALDRSLTQEPFSKSDVADRIVEWQESWNVFMTVFRGSLVNAFSDISLPGRKALIEAFPKQPRCRS